MLSEYDFSEVGNLYLELEIRKNGDRHILYTLMIYSPYESRVSEAHLSHALSLGQPQIRYTAVQVMLTRPEKVGLLHFAFSAVT